MATVYEGVILAAGRGKRMGMLSEFYPKPLLPVANQRLIEFHLAAMGSLGIERVFVVVGHLKDEIPKFFESCSFPDIEVSVVEQRTRLGSADAFRQVSRQAEGPFVLMLGDYFFWAPHLRRQLAVASRLSRSVMAVKEEHDLAALRQACCVALDDDGRVQDIEEKPSEPVTSLKGCGIYVLQPDFLTAVERVNPSPLRNEFEITDALKLYVGMGYELYAESVIEWDRNMTSPEDLLLCNLEWLSRNGLDHLVGSDTVLPPSARVARSVIGSNAVIPSGARIRESLVFPGTRIERRTVSHEILTPHGSVRC